MESMNISLPEGMKEFVETQVNAGQFSTASEYVRQLIRKEQIKKERDRIDKLLLEALDGEFTPMTKQDWDDIRENVRRRRAESAGQ